MRVAEQRDSKKALGSTLTGKEYATAKPRTFQRSPVCY